MSHKILVLDDDDDSCVILEEYLGDCGYTVRSATRATEAVAMAESEKFDLAILDIMLPEGDGIGVLAYLKSVRQSMPVMMLTGLGYDPYLMRESFSKGASAYLTKSQPLNDLLMEIQRVIGRPGGPIGSMAPAMT